MSDCASCRKALLEDPHEDGAAVRAHLDTCRECAEYAAHVRRFEGRLERALRVSFPQRQAATATVIPLRGRAPKGAPPRRVRRGWLAAAASAVLGLVVAGGLWLAAPRDSLAAAVVGHMAHEPDAWVRTDVPVAQGELDHVLAAAHVRLKGDAGLVSYANSCSFRGHVVPHLVVQTPSGPVTVMLLPDEPAHGTEGFDEEGYRGMIVPVPRHGSIAVLERGPDPGLARVQQVASQVMGAIAWTS